MKQDVYFQSVDIALLLTQTPAAGSKKEVYSLIQIYFQSKTLKLDHRDAYSFSRV